jgi:hypothetical protein
LGCALCGTVFEQQYVAVALREEGVAVGDVCPRCLVAGPSGAAGRAGRQAEALRQEGDAGGTRRLRALARGLTEAGGWGVRLEDLLEAERQEVRSRFPGLRTEDLRRLVDEPRARFLAGEPG